MFKIFAAIAFSLISTFAYSQEETNTDNFLTECQLLKSEYKQLMHSEKKVLSLRAVQICANDIAPTAFAKKFLDAILDETGLNMSIQLITWKDVQRVEQKQETMTGTKTGINGLNKITFFALCFLLAMSLVVKKMSWLVHSNRNETGEFAEHFMPCGFIFVTLIIYCPFDFLGGSVLSVAIILISMLTGMIYILVSIAALYMSSAVSAQFYSNNYERALSKSLIETSDSMIEIAVNNYLKIEAAKTNRKNLNIIFNIVKGQTATPTHESVQSTLDCYAKANINVEYNAMLLSGDTMQNNKCYGNWTKLSSMQSFGFVEGSREDLVKQRLAKVVIGFEKEISDLQEEVRRNECVITFDSANRETKRDICIDYKDNKAVDGAGYINYISSSISRAEIESKKKLLVQKIRLSISDEIKKQEEKNIDKYIERNIMYAKNLLLLSPYMTFVNTIYQNISYSDYLDYFGKVVVVFSGYEMKGTKTQLQFGGGNSNLASMTIPVEIEEFNSLANSFLFKKTNYFEQLMVKNNKECLSSFNNCETLKISNFGEFEKNTKDTLTYLSKAYMLMSAFENKSNNNQILSFTTSLVKYSMIACIFLLAANFILPLYYQSMKTLYFFLLLIHTIIQLIFVVPFKAALTWCYGGEYDIVYEVKQLVFNAAVEPAVYMIVYVVLLSLGFTTISIFSIDFSTNNSISSTIFNLDISAWLNTIMSLGLMIFIFTKTHAYSEKITEAVCTQFEVTKFDEIEQELLGYSNKALQKAKKILLK